MVFNPPHSRNYVNLVENGMLGKFIPAQASVQLNKGAVLVALVDFLTVSSTAATKWTVVGSSDGTTAAMDGLNRWTTPTTASVQTTTAPTTNPHSWIILRSGPINPLWQATHLYAVGDYVNGLSGGIYVCVQAGTSAGSGGPTTSTPSADGGVQWIWVAPSPAAGGYYMLLSCGFAVTAMEAYVNVAFSTAGFSLAGVVTAEPTSTDVTYIKSDSTSSTGSTQSVSMVSGSVVGHVLHAYTDDISGIAVWQCVSNNTLVGAMLGADYLQRYVPSNLATTRQVAVSLVVPIIGLGLMLYGEGMAQTMQARGWSPSSGSNQVSHRTALLSEGPHYTIRRRTQVGNFDDVVLVPTLGCDSYPLTSFSDTQNNLAWDTYGKAPWFGPHIVMAGMTYNTVRGQLATYADCYFATPPGAIQAVGTALGTDGWYRMGTKLWPNPLDLPVRGY